MEPADTPGSGWQRAWEVCLQGAPGPGGQVPRGLAAASDPRVLEDSWAGCEVSSRGLPAGPSTRVLSPDLPPEPQVWGTFLVGAAACEALPVCWGARGEVRGGLGSGGGTLSWRRGEHICHRPGRGAREEPGAVLQASPTTSTSCKGQSSGSGGPQWASGEQGRRGGWGLLRDGARALRPTEVLFAAVLSRGHSASLGGHSAFPRPRGTELDCGWVGGTGQLQLRPHSLNQEGTPGPCP